MSNDFYYVAWLNSKRRGTGLGDSVARGTSQEQVMEKAREVFNSPNWQEFEGPEASVTLTRGPKQLFVKSVVLRKDDQRGTKSMASREPSVIGPTPVDIALRAGPRGDGNWQGYDAVYALISRGAENMAHTRAHLSPEHVETMADLGSGHEERMKARALWLRDHGYIGGSHDPSSRQHGIRAGDRVTIVDRFGQQRTGRAVMQGPAGWVLNMGGAHGTPAIANESNIVKVSQASRNKDTVGSRRLSGTGYATPRRSNKLKRS